MQDPQMQPPGMLPDPDQLAAALPPDGQPANADSQGLPPVDMGGGTGSAPGDTQVNLPMQPPGPPPVGGAGQAPLQAPPAGPSLAEQMPLPSNAAPTSINGAMKESAHVANENGAAAQVATTEEQAALRKQAAIDDAESRALAPALEHQKAAADALVSVKKLTVSAYDQQLQKLQTNYAETQQELDAVRAKMHPTDIFGAAGVGRVQGTIAMILGVIGGINDGRNAGVERLDQMAQMRAAQFQQEAQLIEKKGAMQQNMFQMAHQKLGDDQAAYLSTYEAQLEAVKAETQQVANNFRSPRAQAQAKQLVAQLDQKLVAVQAQMGQFNSQQALQGAVAIGQQALEREKMELTAKTKLPMAEADKTEARRMAEAAAATEEAVRLIREIKSGKFSALENAAKRSQLATVLAKAENPGSNRVLTGDTRRSEIEKTGGLAIPFTGGKTRIFDGAGLDNLEQQLIRQQHERDLYTGGTTADRLMSEPATVAPGILRDAPVHQ